MGEKMNDISREDYEANVLKDEHNEGRAISNPLGLRVCEGCVFQRYEMTEKGQCWRCRHPQSDRKTLYYGDPMTRLCDFGIKE